MEFYISWTVLAQDPSNLRDYEVLFFNILWILLTSCLNNYSSYEEISATPIHRHLEPDSAASLQRTKRHNSATWTIDGYSVCFQLLRHYLWILVRPFYVHIFKIYALQIYCWPSRIVNIKCTTLQQRHSGLRVCADVIRFCLWVLWPDFFKNMLTSSIF